MRTAFFARNPLYGRFDRGTLPEHFAGVVQGTDPATGEQEWFYYGVPFEAPEDSTDEELEILEPRG